MSKNLHELSKDYLNRANVEVLKETGKLKPEEGLDEGDINELSKKTLGRYVNTAAAKAADHAADSVDAWEQGDPEYGKFMDSKGKKRLQGIKTAVKKIVKEEGLDELDEVEETNEVEPSAKDTFEFEVDVKEDMDAMFNGSDLSEEFKTKATGIFEAALKANLKKYKDVLDEEFDVTLEEAVNVVAEEMETKVEKYLNYISEQWMSENEVAIESSLRTELTEDFIAGLRNLFLENYIDIPEDKVDIVANMSTQVSELEDKLNEEIKRNIDLAASINEAKKVNVIAAATEGLTDTQAEKIKSLAESTEFTTEEDFTSKVESLKESYFTTKAVKKDTTMIVEVSETPETPTVAEELTGPMATYAKAISKSRPN